MKNIKQQTKEGLCGIYNLANLLQDENIVDFYEYQDEYIPCGNFEANKILKHEGYKYRIQPIIANPGWKFEIPFEYFQLYLNNFTSLIKNKEYTYSFILQVQCADSARSLHAITLLYNDGKYAMSDPRDEEFKLIELPDLLKRYKYVNMISTLVKDDTYLCFHEKAEIFK
jgi:hypothetical protein